MPKVEIHINPGVLDGIRRAAMDAAWETAGAIRGEILTAQVTPMDTGTLQDSGGAIDQHVDGDEIHTELTIGDTAYARRLYFHPEYNFQKGNNPNAQGRWAGHWLPGGDRENFAPDTFRNCMEKRLPK